MEEQDKQPQGERPDHEVMPAETAPETTAPGAGSAAPAEGPEPSPEPTAEAPVEVQPEADAEQPSSSVAEETAEAAAAPDTAPDTTTPQSDILSVDELLQSAPAEPVADAPRYEDLQLKAVLEAVVYVAEEPLSIAQMAASLHEPEDRIRIVLGQLIQDFEAGGHGVCIREIAGGFKMQTKPEHHDAVRNFVKSLKPPLKLSLPALETLAVIAYKQPVTGPEIMEIRGVQGGGVLKTLLDRKLIAAAGRKNVIGKPILYKTTKEFLIQFGLKDLSELPSLKEFEEIRRMAFDGETPPEPAALATASPSGPPPAEAPPAPESTPDASQES